MPMVQLFLRCLMAASVPPSCRDFGTVCAVAASTRNREASASASASGMKAETRTICYPSSLYVIGVHRVRDRPLLVIGRLSASAWTESSVRIAGEHFEPSRRLGRAQRLRLLV